MTATETYEVREYLLDDEIRLLDAWSAPGIADTHYSAGVCSRTDLRRQHGAKLVQEKERAAVSAFDALSRAGGTNPRMQVALLCRLAATRHAIGPDWRSSFATPGRPQVTDAEAAEPTESAEPA